MKSEMVTGTNSFRGLAGKGSERRRYLEEPKGEDCMLGEGGRAHVLRGRDGWRDSRVDN